ncbi:hypothetical protein INF35_07340 [Subdoligranulum sp. DSM 109015]|uniref:Uncharacterized protein n=1 Tax=Gemmiger gallinarum TaxID=2779354 RepID=A0ABR9R370_9FIRM|nr:hypothetical protein [Gemmiger gallinarum]MBE5037595.1 hypothetical protein [Gemmiger gallinarum]
MSPRLPAWLARILGRRPRKPEPRQTPPLPQNPYRRFYTAPRRLEDLAPRPPKCPK